MECSQGLTDVGGVLGAIGVWILAVIYLFSRCPPAELSMRIGQAPRDPDPECDWPAGATRARYRRPIPGEPDCEPAT